MIRFNINAVIIDILFESNIFWDSYLCISFLSYVLMLNLAQRRSCVIISFLGVSEPCLSFNLAVAEGQELIIDSILLLFISNS